MVERPSPGDVSIRTGKNLGFLQKYLFVFIIFLFFRFLKFFLGFNLQIPDTKLRPTSKDLAM